MGRESGENRQSPVLHAARSSHGPHVADFGSRGVTGLPPAWVGPVEGAAVYVVTLAAGTVLDRHPTRLWQLFSVVHGAGWANGADGVPLQTCPTSAVLHPTWPSEERFTSPGSHFVVFAATDSVGVRTRRLLTVQSIPGSRVTATAPARAVYGGAVVVTGVARDTLNRTLVGARATLQALPAGSTVWQTVGSSTTDVEGRVSLRTTARANGAWRILLAGKPGVYAAGVSPTVRTAVSATVVVTRPSSTVYARRAATFSVRSWPYEPVLVSLQVRRAGTTTWLTVARPTLRASTSGSGLAAASVTLSRSGVYYVRAVRASTAKAVGATSALLTVRAW